MCHRAFILQEFESGASLFADPSKPDTISVAKLRLAEIEKIERQRIEIEGAVTSGNMRFGEALATFRDRLLRNGSLKPRSKQFREERIVALLNSRPGLEQTGVRKITQSIGMSNITHHDLRHLFATRCIESGVDIPTVSRWLGHEDGGALAMKTCGHLRNEHTQAMAQKVEL